MKGGKQIWGKHGAAQPTEAVSGGKSGWTLLDAA